MDNREMVVIGPQSCPDAVGYIQSPLSDERRLELIQAIRRTALVVPLPLGDDPISREDDFRGEHLASVTSRGSELIDKLEWLRSYYEGEFFDLACQIMKRNLVCIVNNDKAIMGNVVGRNQRFETHVDNDVVNGNEYLQQGIAGGDLVLGYGNERTHQEVLRARKATIAPITGTIAVVAAQDIPHTVSVVGLKPKSDFKDEDLYQHYLDNLYSRDVFDLPDISSNQYWKNARIAINFAYSTVEFDSEVASGKAISRIGTARIYGDEESESGE